MTKKMTGKPTPVAAASLDDFIAAADPVTATEKLPSEASNAPKGIKQGKSAKRRVGKPPMASEDVRNRTIQIKVTENELNALKLQAQGVPVSSYLRNKLKEKNII